MPRNKTEGLLLSIIMSAVMIYVMAALNNNVQIGEFAVSSWILALKRFPLGFVVGIICDLCICTPLSRKIVIKVTSHSDREIFKILILRFCMVVLMTVAMTVFSIAVSHQTGWAAITGFFCYLPYNFTIALPIQMLIVAPLASRFARKIAGILTVEKV
ncbi:MAG: hypothetical protein ACI4LD_03585 [Lentihominibacter sp.]